MVERGVNLNQFVGRSASVPDVAAFPPRYPPRFLASLPDRDREIALCLARGQGTGEVAQKFGVTAGAISQFRTRFKNKYDAFHTEV